jgi:tetratricopeptide (TPR) repeat protein
VQTGGSKAHFSFIPRVFLCTLTITLSIFLFYWLCLNFVSQLYVQRSDKLIRNANYGLAINSLNKALRFSPSNAGIFKRLGRVHFKIAQITSPQEERVSYFLQAKNYYLEAYRLNPQNSEISYWLGIQEMALEKLYNRSFPESDNNPYQALPYFKRSIELWPNSMVYNYEFSRYLYCCHKDRNEFLPVVSTLFMVYPPVYRHIKKEPMWSPAAREAAKKGLERAIKKGILKNEACRVMSFIFSEEGDWAGAIRQFKSALSLQGNRNSSEDYKRLGYLYLKNKELHLAATYFIKGLQLSRHMEKDLEGIYNFYGKEGYIEERYNLLDAVRHSFMFSRTIEVLTAQSLISLNRFNKAKVILMDLNRKKPTSDAYYLLAKIAQAEEEWDNAEISAQKATVLDTKKSQYHLLFSQILNHLKKFERAEKEAGLAIRYSTKAYPWLFDNRGWIRWKQRKYRMALEDWEFAIKLSPERAPYYARAAECYMIIGNPSVAIDYYKKAVKLDPENRDYQRRYREIELYKLKNPDKTGNVCLDRKSFLCLNQ